MIISDPVAIAMVGASGGLVVALIPIINNIVLYRQKRAEREEDYKRQDMVAEKAAKAARDLVASNVIMAHQNEETQGRLKEIHTLVNSNLTREMQDRLIAVQGQVTLMKEIIRLNRLNNLDPDEKTNVALANLEAVVMGLTVSLRERGGLNS